MKFSTLTILNRFYLMNKIYSLFSLPIIVLSVTLFCNIISPDIRFVSKTGSSKPPYTSWETASDSIQKCVNVCNSGDTIYVANGVYKEVVVMIRGLSLIGSSMDSCAIDTRSLVYEDSFYAITMFGKCLLKNFHIIVSDYHPYTYTWWGTGVYIFDTTRDISVVEYNLIEDAEGGVLNSIYNGVVQNNIIRNTNTGVFLDWYDINIYPLVINNYIISGENCIATNFGTSPIIRNNILIVVDNKSGIGGGGISSISIAGFTQIYNNLIIATGTRRMSGIGAPNGAKVINNVVVNASSYGIFTGTNCILKNNVITGSSYGYDLGQGSVMTYNNVWNCQTNYSGPIPDSTNMSVGPMFTNDSTDFHLQMFSPLIDKGDPTILDKDGTRSDIGLYGGPYGERYEYPDLAPKAPRGLILTRDSNYVTIKWKKNAEADFNHYNLYRDTVAGFTANAITFVSALIDTIYIHIVLPGISKYFYKLTAADNQGNISSLSEELGINITSVNDKGQTISQYNLFQNYPNPFNPSTIISYRLKERGFIKLLIYNIKGEIVRVLVNKVLESGYYETEFNASNLSSGIYIYKLEIINDKKIPVYTSIKKMIYLK
jgi:hypothetical protein